MKKQGFSLIELMVTIVIMGTIAAVAVPKLFGFMAKSKASEITVAAGTYIKMQEAYIHERTQGGTWFNIGYKSPAGNSTGKASTTNFEYDADQTVHNWTAAANVPLNDCEKGKKWFVNYKLNPPHDMKYWASTDDATNCLASLIPSFRRLSTTETPITKAGE
ncbi:type IV pilin protein [Fibrobacter sp. UWB11]|uniref:type IV pilin protein n=1 Tax=Fibrobacter sp. UWB11 TaxID=1896202 RepID=UPI000927CA40|nr:type II secretion system protein [Fibrobacter sp. UWB11]SIN81574.1 prepilin-type N-terminal cleavage/methylation domain-containing protein [Fibrobacter sp. UWB11]